jgi:hypothetical protein
MNVPPVPPLPPAPRRPFAGLVLGLLILLFGLTWLADALGFEQVHDALRDFWPWPAILVLIGFSLIIRTNRRVVPGLILILLGAALWARNESLVNVPLPLVFGPALVVLVGASVLWRALVQPGPLLPAGPYVRAFAVLSGDEVRASGTFEGAHLAAFLGSTRLDLSRTSMAGESVTIDVSLLMGSAEILVPPDWDLILQVGTFMGGCADRRRAPRVVSAHRLIVRGNVLMGGVLIRD